MTPVEVYQKKRAHFRIIIQDVSGKKVKTKSLSLHNNSSLNLEEIYKMVRDMFTK